MSYDGGCEQGDGGRDDGGGGGGVRDDGGCGFYFFHFSSSCDSCSFCCDSCFSSDASGLFGCGLDSSGCGFCSSVGLDCGCLIHGGGDGGRGGDRGGVIRVSCGEILRSSAQSCDATRVSGQRNQNLRSDSDLRELTALKNVADKTAAR